MGEDEDVHKAGPEPSLLPSGVTDRLSQSKKAGSGVEICQQIHHLPFYDRSGFERHIMTDSEFAEEPRRFEAEETGLRSVGYVRLKIDGAGRIVIPAEMRAAMLVKPGDTVTARVEAGEFRIVSPDVALKRVQAFARKWKAEHPDAPDIVDEFIAERREEARREDERYDRLAREGHGHPASGSRE